MKCEYCGEETGTCKTYCKLCIVDDVYYTLLRGEMPTTKLMNRAYRFDIKIKEIREEISEDKRGRIS